MYGQMLQMSIEIAPVFKNYFEELSNQNLVPRKVEHFSDSICVGYSPIYMAISHVRLRLALTSFLPAPSLDPA